MKEQKPSHRKAKRRCIGPGGMSPPRTSNIRELRAELTRTREEADQRTAELSLINSVQQALASQLDVQAIYDLVGEKVRAIFNAQVVMISLYDPQANTIEHRYAIERGERVYAPGPRPMDGFRNRIVQSRAPLLVNREVTRLMAELGQSVLPGTATPQSWLGVPMIVGRQLTGVISLQNLDQEEAFGESDVSLLQTLASSMSVALENARLFSEIRRRAAELATINRISTAFASQWEVGALIQLAGEQIRETFNADIAYVALLDRSSKVIHFPYSFGETFREIPFGQGLTSKILKTGQPLLINRDLETRRVEIGATQVGTVVKSYLGVPILVGAEAIGAVSVQSIQQEGRFNENDQRLLMTIAATVGAAIENARLYAQAQQVGVMEERNRLARDLHDAVTQTLFSASLIADALPASWESDPEEGRQLSRELRQLSRGALAEMRTLLLELRPATLTESSLASLIRQLGEAAAGREGLSVTVNAELECRLPPEVHVALYRIAQEALNNVVKHARASQVIVSLQCISVETNREPKERVVLCVADDGRGFDIACVPPDHFGLGNMRERAQAIGATLAVESQPGHGTRIKVEWQKGEEEKPL